MTRQFTMRTRAEVTSFFDGLTLVDPGVVLTHEWRPDSPDDAKKPGVLRGGVGRQAQERGGFELTVPGMPPARPARPRSAPAPAPPPRPGDQSARFAVF